MAPSPFLERSSQIRMLSSLATILGPPRRVIEQLEELIAQTPATEIALGMQQPGLDPKLAMRSLKRFSTEVLPVLRKG
jgi:alkanesulfonate monooxygenase SsuD/methylene tetrahydromethanopterin reductase-like flavin-dependent oxidoreductase (luciferase family)